MSACSRKFAIRTSWSASTSAGSRTTPSSPSSKRTYLDAEHRDPVTFAPHTADLHRLVHLERFPRRTEYTEIVREVDRLFSHAPFSERATLVVDATGVGAPFVDLLKTYLRMKRQKLMPVVITGGDTINKQPNAYNVPRETLLGKLENLTKERTLRVSKHLQLAIDFFRELAALRITTTPAGRQTIQPARSMQHDDMVFSVALAAFADCAYKAVNVRSPSKPTIDAAATSVLTVRPLNSLQNSRLRTPGGAGVGWCGRCFGTRCRRGRSRGGRGSGSCGFGHAGQRQPC